MPAMQNCIKKFPQAYKREKYVEDCLLKTIFAGKPFFSKAGESSSDYTFTDDNKTCSKTIRLL
jgi:hypothetical protein